MGVKTAISVPDDIYELASRRARELGMSRSELFSRAAGSYLDALDRESLPDQIDSVLGSLESDDDSVSEAVVRGRRLIASATEEW